MTVLSRAFTDCCEQLLKIKLLCLMVLFCLIRKDSIDMGKINSSLLPVLAASNIKALDEIRYIQCIEETF